MENNTQYKLGVRSQTRNLPSCTYPIRMTHSQATPADHLRALTASFNCSFSFPRPRLCFLPLLSGPILVCRCRLSSFDDRLTSETPSRRACPTPFGPLGRHFPCAGFPCFLHQSANEMVSMHFLTSTSPALAMLSWALFLALGPGLAAAASAADYYVHSLPGAPDNPLLKMHAG